MESGKDEEEDIIITHVSPPPPKRHRLERREVVEIGAGDPLRCSTPQPPGGPEPEDATLEELGISHDSIDAFIDDVCPSEPAAVARSTPSAPWPQNALHCTKPLDQIGEEFGIDNDYAEAFLREEEEDDEVTLTNGDGKGEVGRSAVVGRVPEIMEEVLSHLPVSHLYTSCRLVCRKWNDIIQRKKFLYWKKLYYKYKSGRCPEASKTVTSLSQKVWTLSLSCTLKTVTLPLVRFVSEEFKDLEVGEASEKALLSHPQSPCVARIRELFPTIESPQCCTAVATAALLVMCSRSVHEVCSVIASLLAPPCKRVDVIEVFYCLSTFFLAGCHELSKFTMRLHYNLFYALCLHERSSCCVATSELVKKPSAGQQSLHKYGESSGKELTAEQAQVVNHRLHPGEVVKVLAFAGTGKTTTLLRFTALNPHMTFLYCVYNKSVQEHASTIFPPNVKCKTFHSLAHGCRGDPLAVGWRYVFKKGTTNSYTISQCVGGAPVGQSLNRFSSHIFRTLEKFIASGDNDVQLEHVPTTVTWRRRRSSSDEAQ
jgi:F-box protein 18 (helicase)